MFLEVSKNGTISSLDLLKEVNFWRAKESENSEKQRTELRHDTLLNIIRDEFEEEISLQKILESEYINERGRKLIINIIEQNSVKKALSIVEEIENNNLC